MTPSQPDLESRLAQHIDHLPALPMALARLIELDRDDDDYFDRVLAVVETEPNLATRLLAHAKSVSADSIEPIRCLKTALSRIGTAGAEDMALALSVTRVFIPRDAWERALWRHALQVAIASRRLVAYSSDNSILPEEAYACGLLHDVGRFVMFLEAPDDLRRIDESGWEGGEGLLEAELSICGLTHAELGAQACERWGLPPMFIRVVRDHHASGLIVPPDHSGKLTAIVRMADRAMFPSAIPGALGRDEDSDGVLQRDVLKLAPGFLQLSAGLAPARSGVRLRGCVCRGFSGASVTRSSGSRSGRSCGALPRDNSSSRPDVPPGGAPRAS